MTLPFDMEVYTKQLLRSNSHNVGEPGKQFNKLSINQIQAKFDMSATLTKSSICSCPESPAWTKHPLRTHSLTQKPIGHVHLDQPRFCIQRHVSPMYHKSHKRLGRTRPPLSEIYTKMDCRSFPEQSLRTVSSSFCLDLK